MRNMSLESGGQTTKCLWHERDRPCEPRPFTPAGRLVPAQAGLTVLRLQETVVGGSWRNEAARHVLGRYKMPMVPAWNDSVPLWEYHRCRGLPCWLPLVLSASTSSMEQQHAPVGVSQVLRAPAALLAPLVPSTAASSLCSCTPMHITSWGVSAGNAQPRFPSSADFLSPATAMAFRCQACMLTLCSCSMVLHSLTLRQSSAISATISAARQLGRRQRRSRRNTRLAGTPGQLLEHEGRPLRVQEVDGPCTSCGHPIQSAAHLGSQQLS